MTTTRWVTRRVDPRDLPEVLRKNGYSVEQRSAPTALAALFPECIALRFTEKLQLHRIADAIAPIDVVFVQQAVYEHALVSRGGLVPNWATLEWVKCALWGADATVLQIHGRGIDYGELPGRCLHLWRPLWPFEDSERRAVDTASKVLGRQVFLPHLRAAKAR